MPPANDGRSGSVTFTFKNVGPVRDAALELGDLTIIAGRNNTGKTYLTYTLYGFLKTLDTWPGAIAWPFGGHHAGPPTIFEQLFKQVEEEGHAAVTVDRDALDRQREEILRKSTESFSRSRLADTFNSPADTFEGASIGVDLNSAFPDSPRAVDVRIRGNETLSIRLNGNDILVTTSAPGELSLTDLRLAPYVARLYLRFLFPELPFDPFVLSAERLGISLFYRELDFSKSQLVDLLQKFGGRKEDEDRSWPFFLVDQTFSRYARPIKDNIDYTRSIPDLRRHRSELYGDGLFNDIRSLMGGDYSASKDEVVFRSAARGPRRFTIPLHLASSSARGLSDLYFFLRHVARKDQLLVIDEPESHLDTANQILLARLLARVVNAGVKVLLTTHSDYLIKEINNLIMLGHSFRNKAKVIKRLKYGEDDHLGPNRIRAYIAKKNTLTKCDIDRFGIDMPNFDQTINEINDAANELAARLADDEAN